MKKLTLKQQHQIAEQLLNQDRTVHANKIGVGRAMTQLAIGERLHFKTCFGVGRSAKLRAENNALIAGRIFEIMGYSVIFDNDDPRGAATGDYMVLERKVRNFSFAALLDTIGAKTQNKEEK